MMKVFPITRLEFFQIYDNQNIIDIKNVIFSQNNNVNIKLKTFFKLSTYGIPYAKMKRSVSDQRYKNTYNFVNIKGNNIQSQNIVS